MNYDIKNCFSRLPCGLCRLTNAMCPFAEGSNYEVTCGTSLTNVEVKEEQNNACKKG